MSRLPSLGPRGEGWFALQMVLLAAIGLAALLAPGAWVGVLQLLGVGIGVAALLCGFWLGLSGIRSLDLSLSPLPRPTAQGQLVVAGPYRWVRHPIYDGVILAALGWSLAWSSALALVPSLALVVLFDLKARREEAWLQERYPRYAEYAARTRRFVPGLY